MPVPAMTSMPIDTLSVDSTVLAPWQSDASYDYSRELMQSDKSIWDQLSDWLTTLLTHTAHWSFDSDSSLIFWIIATVVIVGAVVAILFVRHPALFMRQSVTDKLDYTVTEDTIYGIDFDAMIARAMTRADYAAAVRLIYLQTLRRLSDAGRIKWIRSKAPMQYVRELGDAHFRQLTLRFLQVRYGCYACSQAEADEMLRWQQAVCPPTDERGGAA